MPKEEFELYQNKYYELVEFYLRWDARTGEGIWALSKHIRIKDRETGTIGIPEVF